MPEKDKRRGSVPIAEVLPSLLSRLRPSDEPDLRELCKRWEGVVGEEAARNARPAALKGSLLLVQVSSPAWIHHLRFLKADLLTRLNADPRRPPVADIKFKVGGF